MKWFVLVVCAPATMIAALRWLRVAQREHYLAGSTFRFARRWWFSSWPNLTLAVLATGAIVSSIAVPAAALAVAPIAVWAPIGLSLKGRTSPLAWTRRLRTVAITVAVIDAALFAVATASDRPEFWVAALTSLQPMVIDAALKLLVPVERRAMQPFVDQATERLRAVDPVTVAITGSYGKTTTKNYLRHLVSGSRSVLASPASFNNTGGLARTMNEHLTPGTEVLIAEMGTYGKGEIAAMCRWVRPTIVAICNIGPVHLERMRSLDGIVAAKREITDIANNIVLNVDAHQMAPLADELVRRGAKVLRVSGTGTGPGGGADVVVTAGSGGLTVRVNGSELATVADRDAAPSNVAVAVGLALMIGIDPEAIAARLGDLPTSEHRHEVITAASGAMVIDNTFSSNPASAEASLALLNRRWEQGDGRGRRIVVTPGMVELGMLQFEENQHLGAQAARWADTLIIVGRTNAQALRSGAGDEIVVIEVGTRPEAVEWVRANARLGDVVLYEGDLPDHYP